MPQINPNWFRVDPWVLIIGAIIIVVFSVIAVIWSIKAHRLQVAAGREDLIGKTAVADTALEPKGVVFIEGERWTAISDGGKVEPEDEVIITKVEGLKVWVTKKV